MLGILRLDPRLKPGVINFIAPDFSLGRDMDAWYFAYGAQVKTWSYKFIASNHQIITDITPPKPQPPPPLIAGQ